MTIKRNTTQPNYNVATKKGFTLIELIFTIVIIGVLAAVAIPKYKNLKDNAEFNQMVKIISDATTSVPSAYYNAIHLNGESPDTMTIDKLINVEGKGLTLDDDNAYRYRDMTKQAIAQQYIYTLKLFPGDKFEIYVHCYNLSDTIKQKCSDLFPSNVSGQRYHRRTIEL